jgi:hypothetical protein
LRCATIYDGLLEKTLTRKRYWHYEQNTQHPFKNGGSVNLESLKSLSPGVLFDNGRHIYLDSLESLSSDVIFNNGGHVFLESIISISPGVVFNNKGDVMMNSFFNHFFGDWEGKVSGISSKRLLNKMIKDRLFDRK